MELTQERLKELVEYNPETGVFTRKTSYGAHKKDSVAGTVCSNGYRAIVIDRQAYKEHRLAFLYMLGHIPTNVDHINVIRGDNRWVNLREASTQQNTQNTRLIKSNTSGIKGISFVVRGGCECYRASIEIHNKSISKVFNPKKYTKEGAMILATQWIQNKRLELHGEFANHG
jgi:hypothetical protein